MFFGLLHGSLPLAWKRQLSTCGDEPSKTDWKVEHTTDALKTIRNAWVKIQDAEYN